MDRSDSQVLNEFSEVVESIYDAALEPTRWPKAVQRIATLHGCEKALLFTAQLAPAQGGFAFPVGISERAMLDWGSSYIQHDIWAQALIRHDVGVDRPNRVFFGTDFVDDEEFLRSVFYRDFLKFQDIRRVCAGMIFDFRDRDALGTFCSVFGPHARAPFDEQSRHVHALLVNHLSRSLGTMLRLRDAELRLASTLGALNRLPGCILLLGQKGQVLFANEPAQRLLAEDDGLRLRRGAVTGEGIGWLQASRTLDSASLLQQIRRPSPPIRSTPNTSRTA